MDTSRCLSDLYPEIDPYESGILEVSATHKLYWEQSGNPNGAPALFLHGGPGSGATPVHRRFFDPAHYRIIIVDQRGAGRSLPLGALEDNTTPHLLADLEKLRNHIGIERWLVFGGSWGSSLALAYAIAHPRRCIGLILRGVFLCRAREVAWFMSGMGTIFPEAWRAFSDHLPPEERSDLLANYYQRLTDPDPEIHLPAAQAWSRYELACSALRPSPETVIANGNPNLVLGLARIEAHYFIHNLFMDEGELLARAEKYKHLPGAIIQGRYDIVCPITSAADLAAAWPDADYTVVPDAGHSAMEPGIRRALVRATDHFREYK